MLRFDGLTAGYGKRQVLKKVRFSLEPGSITALLGKNGSGKSTLLSCVNRQLPYGGEIFCGEENLRDLSPEARAKKIAILPQSLAAPPIPVEELVLFGRNPYLGFGQRPSREDREAVQRAMEAVGISLWRGRRVNALSGGERQRAYLAMILAQEAPVILLDEPTTYLDVDHQGAFFQTLLQLKTRYRKTLLVILHDLNQAVRWADRILVLEEGRIAFDGTSAACLDSGVLEATFSVEKHMLREKGRELGFFVPK